MFSINNINIPLELAILAGSVAASTGLYYVAIKNWSKWEDATSAISKISQAETVPIAGLPSLLSSNSESGSASSKEMLVLVGGYVEASSNKDSLVSQLSDEKCVFLEQTWRSMPYRERITLSTNSPFIVSESFSGRYQKHAAAHALVYLEGSNHQLPLETISKNFPKMPTSSSEFLVKEMFLPIGRSVTVVGVCSLQDGNLQIKACNELPFFITTLSGDGMMRHLISTRDTSLNISLAVSMISMLILILNLPRVVRLWKKLKQVRGKGKLGKIL